MKSLGFWFWVLFGILSLGFGVYGCQGHKLYRSNRALMGTFVGVSSPDKRAGQIAFAEIARIEGLLSKYKPDSEVARLNREGKLKVSPETFYIIKKSKDFWQVSLGAFDITVAPLVDLWGFTDKNFRVPSDEEVRNVLPLIGSDKIILHDNENVVELSLPGMKIDLGAIAKGYAVDCALKKLKAAGVKSCLVNAGGQIGALGEKFGSPWTVAIRGPRSNGFIGYIDLKDEAVATSGDYEQYFVKENKRYAHIIDPHTGYPADSQVISATVVAPDGMTADALATAICVMGKDRGEELAKVFPGARTNIIEKKEARFLKN